jgi:SAM-dependent methyltransferase
MRRLRLWEKFCNRGWEYKLGINTRGMAQALEPDSCHYVPHSYSLTWAILHSLTLSSSDVFVDIGCGKGRVICCAACFNIREVTGVEISKNLCEIAERNAIRLSGRRAPITIINTPAQDCDYLKGTVFYLFNPFGALTLRRVLAKIQLSLSAHPRFVRIVYVNPQHESLLQVGGWLELYDRWESGRRPELAHDISFWRSKDARKAWAIER